MRKRETGLKRVWIGIRAFWIGFIIFPLAAIWIFFEVIWDLIWESRIRNKSKQR